MIVSRLHRVYSNHYLQKTGCYILLTLLDYRQKMGKAKKRKNSGEKQEAKKTQSSTTPSALFTPPSSSMSLTSCIFGADNKEDKSKRSNNLFSSTFQNVSRKHQQDNMKKRQQETRNDVQSILSPETILGRRQKLTEATRRLVDTITVDVSSYQDEETHSSSEEVEDSEVEQGVARLLVGRCGSLFRKQGVIILKSLLPDDTLLKDLQSTAETVQSKVCQRLDAKLGRESYLPPSRITSAEGTQAESKDKDKDSSFRFQEVASRCLGRLDIRHGMDQPPFSNLHPSGDSNYDNSFSKTMWPLVKDLLGDDAQLVYMGLISSFPNSQDQPWHQVRKQDLSILLTLIIRLHSCSDTSTVAQDGTALFPDASPDLMDKLPPYALNVFVPLLDITEDLGPTELWLASHCTDDARQTFLKEQSGLAYEKLMEKKNIIGPLLKAGDALIYDYRICHRGTSNLSKAVRPMLYLMYARPWFKEHLNFGTERLFATRGNEDQDESE